MLGIVSGLALGIGIGLSVGVCVSVVIEIASERQVTRRWETANVRVPDGNPATLHRYTAVTTVVLCGSAAV